MSPWLTKGIFGTANLYISVKLSSFKGSNGEGRFHKGRSMERKPLNSVLSTDLDKVLAQLGILSDVEMGRRVCPSCGRKISKYEIGLIYPKEGRILASCNRLECVERLASGLTFFGQ